MRKSNEALMPLAMAGLGRDVTIAGIDAGRGLNQRLADMGLLPGVSVRIVSDSISGPFVVALKEMRIVLGRGMANKILVR